MTKSYSKWDREAEAAKVAPGRMAEAKRKLDAYVNAWHLAERRKNAGLTQEEVAEIMGVTKSRVSQIERGEVASIPVLARYVEAIGGRLNLTAEFPESTLKLRDVV